MRIFNTVPNAIMSIFASRMARSAVPPTKPAIALFTRMAPLLRPLSQLCGAPSVQLYGPVPFEYAGRNFGIDVTWMYPDGAVDGITISFMVEEHGRSYQYVLFDHQGGTVHDLNLSPYGLSFDLQTIVDEVRNYCLASHQHRTFSVP
jgi:hypothetical protein